MDSARIFGVALLTFSCPEMEGMDFFSGRERRNEDARAGIVAEPWGDVKAWETGAGVRGL